MKKAKENWIKVGKVVDGQIVPPPPPEPEEFSIDLSPAFIAGTGDNFPNAAITFDRFHVKKLLNNTMDEVRKSERKEH